MAPLTPERIAAKVQNLRQHYAARDQKMHDVHAVRQGDMQSVYADLFPPTWPKPIIANFVETVARDLSEVMAPLPAFNCSSATMVSDRARKFADKRTKIAHHYITTSELQRQMFDAADQYVTYGFVPFFIEPDFEDKVPRIRTESPIGGYPEFDRWRRLQSYTKIYRKTAREIWLLYPELQAQIRGPGSNFDQTRADNALLEMVRYQDKDQTVLFLPQRNALVLETLPNPCGELMVEVAVRPNGTDDEQSGQFDDVIWVQIARAYMAMLGLEATEKSVQAPLALPSDVQEFSFGPDAVIRTQNPQNVRRVGLELPPGAFQEQQMLDDEQRVGSRYPDARTGNVQSSVITGQGVQALMGGFDTQIKTAQEVLKNSLRKVIGKAFCLDEHWWPTIKRTIRGEHNGSPFEITYTPQTDIAGDYTVDVSYGFLAGLNPNQAIVLLLQARGDKWISRDLAQRQLPFDINVTQEQSKIDVEEVRDSLKQGLYGLSQAMPELVASGQSPASIIGQLAQVVVSLQKGETIEAAAAIAFPPPPPPSPVDPNAPPGAPGAPDGSAPGLQPDGQVSGVAPGQAGEGQGGRPSLQALMAGLTSSGAPSLQANVTQRIPVQP